MIYPNKLICQGMLAYRKTRWERNNITSCDLDPKTNPQDPRCPPKLSLLSKMMEPWATSCSKHSKRKWMSGRWQEQEIMARIR